MTLTELRKVLYKTYQRCTNKIYGAHHTRFKNELLKYITSLKALKKGKKHRTYYRRFNNGCIV